MQVENTDETQQYLANVTPEQLIFDYIMCKGYDICHEDWEDLPTNPIYIQIVEDLHKLVKLAEVRPDLD